MESPAWKRHFETGRFMNVSHELRRKTGWVFLLILLAFASPNRASAQLKFFKKQAKPSQVQQSLDDYLKTVRGPLTDEERTTGSLWSPLARLSNTASDYKARRTGDLLIIRVVDNFSATNNGSIQGQRAFSASSGVSAFLGNLGAANRAQNLFSPTSAQNLNGKGQSALSSTISLNLAGRVVEALPNGVLVVEAVRDFTVGNDRQTIILRGLVRPGDIASDGSVPSSNVSNLEAEVHGKGAVADSIREPNVIIRALLKIFNF
jgi:flagellar L-ring protein precursor FlgH